MFVFPNKAHAEALRLMVRIRDANEFRRGTLGIAVRNARRSRMRMLRAATRDNRANVVAIANGLRDITRWDP